MDFSDFIDHVNRPYRILTRVFLFLIQSAYFTVPCWE